MNSHLKRLKWTGYESDSIMQTFTPDTLVLQFIKGSKSVFVHARCTRLAQNGGASAVDRIVVYFLITSAALLHARLNGYK